MQYLPLHRSRVPSKGFTLAETLVAIAILLMVIIGPITAAQNGIRQAYLANEQTAAVFIAQEAIESIRELRDERALAAYCRTLGSSYTEAWCDDEIGSSATAGETEWSVPICSGTVNLPCRGTKNPVTSDTNGVSYTRTITVSPTTPGDFQSVTVEVSWYPRIYNCGGVDTVNCTNPYATTPRKIVLQTYLYDHYRRYEP